MRHILLLCLVLFLGLRCPERQSDTQSIEIYSIPFLTETVRALSVDRLMSMAQTSTSGFHTLVNDQKTILSMYDIIVSNKNLDTLSECNEDPRIVILLHMAASTDTLAVGWFRSSYKGKCFTTDSLLLREISYQLPELHKNDIDQRIEVVEPGGE